MNTKIYIVDEIMGRGKTSAAINHINQSADTEHFLVITPYKDEIKRYIDNCKSKRFVQPKYTDGDKRYNSKLESIKDLIRDGRNIVSTHALFQKFDDEVIYLCNLFHYTLIMDEVADVVNQFNLGEKDLNILKNSHCIEIDDTGKVAWVDNQYGESYEEGRFDDIRNLCNFGSLYYYGGKLYVWMFPVEAFKAFHTVYIMTYMFNAQIQRYYYDFYNLDYTFLHIAGNSIDTYRFSPVKEESEKHNYKELIHILDNEKLNSIGDVRTALSSTWYEKNSNTLVMKKLKNNAYNFYRNISKADAEDFMWCTFNDYIRQLVNKGFTKRHLAINARATNDYRNCTAIAYLVNRYLNPVIKNFFFSRGVEVDEDGFALSEMLQFIWRSAIREHNEINVYIPSSRMRGLLAQWIEENSNQER